MTDRFGVPDNYFGIVPDDFYGLVGRIGLVAALLDDRILGLLWALDDRPHPTHAGRPTSQLESEIRKRLDLRAEALGKDLVAEIDTALAGAVQAIEDRHALLHSLWPQPTMEKAQGWRSKRVKGSEHGSEVVWFETSGEKLQQCLDELVRMIEAVLVVTNKAWGVRSAP